MNTEEKNEGTMSASEPQKTPHVVDGSEYSADGRTLLRSDKNAWLLIVKEGCTDIAASARPLRATAVMLPSGIRTLAPDAFLPPVSAVFFMGTPEGWKQIKNGDVVLKRLHERQGELYFYSPTPIKHCSTWVFSPDGVTPQIKEIGLN